MKNETGRPAEPAAPFDVVLRREPLLRRDRSAARRALAVGGGGLRARAVGADVGAGRHGATRRRSRADLHAALLTLAVGGALLHAGAMRAHVRRRLHRVAAL